MIRIISGRWRGKKIQAPKKLPVRPTTDMAKESLFNILNNHFYFEEIKALDLFAGTGNISYELSSRGCEDITAVDADTGCIRFMEKTADSLEMEGLKVIRQDALQFLQRDFRQYDLIFADPPYDFEGYEKIVDPVFLNKLLTEDGLLVIEHQERQRLDELDFFKESRKYGNARFSFFGRKQETEDGGKED